MYSLTFHDFLRMLWWRVTSSPESELRARLEMCHEHFDRVVGERDAAFAENARLEAEVLRLMRQAS